MKTLNTGSHANERQVAMIGTGGALLLRLITSSILGSLYGDLHFTLYMYLLL
jgi:hypothetical protein